MFQNSFWAESSSSDDLMFAVNEALKKMFIPPSAVDAFLSATSESPYQRAIKILHISDTHNYLSKEVSVDPWPDADILIHTGDFSMCGSDAEFKQFNDWLGSVKHKYPVSIIVLGNHDTMLHRDHMRAMFNLLTNATHCVCDFDVSPPFPQQPIIVHGISFYGFPWINTRKPKLNFAERLKKVPENVQFLLTHGPVYGILDGLNGEHYGSKHLIKKMIDIKPLFHLYGSVHECSGSRFQTYAHLRDIGRECGVEGMDFDSASARIEEESTSSGYYTVNSSTTTRGYTSMIQSPHLITCTPNKDRSGYTYDVQRLTNCIRDPHYHEMLSSNVPTIQSQSQSQYNMGLLAHPKLPRGKLFKAQGRKSQRRYEDVASYAVTPDYVSELSPVNPDLAPLGVGERGYRGSYEAKHDDYPIDATSMVRPLQELLVAKILQSEAQQFSYKIERPSGGFISIEPCNEGSSLYHQLQGSPPLPPPPPSPVCAARFILHEPMTTISRNGPTLPKNPMIYSQEISQPIAVQFFDGISMGQNHVYDRAFSHPLPPPGRLATKAAYTNRYPDYRYGNVPEAVPSTENRIRYNGLS